MSVPACQLGRKPLCNSSACETGNAAQTDSWLQRIKSLILTKEVPQKSSQSQTDSKNLEDLVVRWVTEGCSRQRQTPDSLAQQRKNKCQYRETQEPHGNAFPLFTAHILPQTLHSLSELSDLWQRIKGLRLPPRLYNPMKVF